MKTLKERFETIGWEVTDTGCHNWLGTTIAQGYGRIRGGSGRGLILAHRAAFEIYNGDIPESLLVRHICDNMACVNPEHLILGTQIDNMADRRLRTGFNTQKLSDEQVIEIRNRRATGEQPRFIAADYGIHPHYVWELCNRTRRTNIL